MAENLYPPQIYSFKSPRLQIFSLPSNIIYYITKNPKFANGYQKLIQTCKYFYSKNPIIVVDYFGNNQNHFSLQHNGRVKCFELSKTYKILCKFWLNEYVSIQCWKSFNAFFIKKIIGCNRLDINSYSRDITPFESLKFVAQNFIGLKRVCLYSTEVKYSDGKKNVPIEEVLELFPNIEEFRFFNVDSLILTSNTAKKIIELPNFKNLKYFSLGKLTKDFDFQTFSEAMKAQKETYFSLEFTGAFPKSYRNCLQKFKTQMNSIDFTNPPNIQFFGHVSFE